MCKCGSLTPYVSDCCCGPKPLTLEVGKVYVSDADYKYKVMEISGGKVFARFLTEKVATRFHLRIFNLAGKDISDAGAGTLVKEFKEPVVHKKDVVWYRYFDGPKIFTVILAVGADWNPANSVLLKRETVSYTE